jgi:hypothetical protein
MDMKLKEAFSNIFGTSAQYLVRKEDPQTSHIAANNIDSATREIMVYEAIASFGDDGCISDDIIALFPFFPYSSITARYSALKRKRLIEVIGSRIGRSGKPQSIMRALPLA